LNPSKLKDFGQNGYCSKIKTDAFGILVSQRLRRFAAAGEQRNWRQVAEARLFI